MHPTPAVLGGGPAPTPPTGTTTLDAFLRHWAATKPDAVAHTFTDHLGGLEPVTRTYTWRELDRWTRAVAAVLEQTADQAPGERARVAILAANSPEYVVSFLAALRAGVVAVPLFAPDLFGHAERLALVLADCRPTVVLTTSDKVDLVETFLDGLDLPRPAVLCPDDLDGPAGDALADTFADRAHDPDALAYVQYTSGSTRTPAGVELSHRSVVTNALQLAQPHRVGEHTTAVSWLPLFHDMGLMLGAVGPVVYGAHAVLTDPLAFVVQPSRWVRALGSHPHTITAAPSFAFELAARRTRPQDLDGVDLSRVDSLVNGAEPVQPGAIERFHAAFEPFGLRRTAMAPSYGLAEATVLVTSTPLDETPTVLDVRLDGLQADRFVVEDLGADGRRTGTTRLVASGRPCGQTVAIVDPVTRRVREDGEVGEIWVHGVNVASGYAGRPDLTAELFGATLDDAPDGTPEGPWLRTGDLGALHDGLLVVTGRLKDLIIVDGRNVYPQDVEVSVQEADTALARNRLAAFAVPGPGGAEAVVVVAERHRTAHDVAARVDDVERAVRAAVSADHGVALHDLVLVEPDTVPRTSSGKIARQATRTAYLEGALVRVPGTGPADRAGLGEVVGADA